MGADATIEELAAEFGLPVSTIRLYQNRRILPPPVKRGRVGYYGDDHRERLRLIAGLQERGFSLAAIREAVDAWGSGRSLDDLLGVSRPGSGEAGGRAPLRLSAAELAERFDGVELTLDDLTRAAALGLVSLEGTDVVVGHADFAELGPAVARLGVPISEILDEYEALQAAVAGIAERFGAVFDRHLWADFVEEGQTEEAAAGVVAGAGKLIALAQAVVALELDNRFGELVDERVRRIGADGA